MARRKGFADEEIKWIAPVDVRRDPTVNRFYEEYRAEKMVRSGFDPKRARTAGYVVSSRRDGSIIWIDGQHRGAASVLAGVGDTPVPMTVLSDLTKAQEAEWVLLYQEDRKRTTPADAHRLGVKAKRAADVVLDATCQKYGLIANGGSGPNSLGAVAAARRIADQDEGARILDLVLGSLTEAYGADSTAVEAPLLGGMALFWGANNGNVDRSALIRKMSKTKPESLIATATSLREMRGRSLANNVANAVVGLYNRGRRSGELEEV